MKNIVFSIIFSVMITIDLFAQTQKETIITEDDGFKWVITETFNSKGFKRGAKSSLGKDLIPCEYDVVYYRNHYFYAVQVKGEASIYALFSKDGSRIIPISEQASELLVMSPEVGSPFVLIQKGGKYGTYSLSGEEIIKVEYDNLFAHEGNFYTRSKDGKMTLVGNRVKPTGQDKIENEVYKECSTQPRTSSQSSSSSSSNQPNNIVSSNYSTPQPTQVWIACGGCYGSGTCQLCYGDGWTLDHNSERQLCRSCHGRHFCTFCNGQKGHYETIYR